MPRRRSRGRRYRDDYYDDYDYRPRRRPRQNGCLAPIRRFFQKVAITFLIIIGSIVIFCLVLLIAFNFAAFVQILYYALFVGAGLAILGVIYLVVRLIAAMSHKISAASVARSKAKMERERVRIEQERVRQARVQVQRDQVQVRSQQAKLAREDYVFSRKYEQPDPPQIPRRTRNFRDDPSPDYPAQQSPYRTRNLRDINQEPLVRVLPALSEPEPEMSELEALGMPMKGQIFAYKRYRKYLKPGQLIIGIRKDGSPRIGDWQDFKITLILGASSSGKSTTVLEKCVCHVQNRRLLVVCDPGGFKPDSITQRMGALQDALMPGTIVALEHEDIMMNLERFRVELERRRRGASMDIPILLIIDELNGLLMDKEIKKDLTELIEKFAQQARGYNMYMILCAQRASGLAAIRNSVISFVCHKCPEMEASKILPARYAKLAPQLGIGQTFVSDANGFIDPLQQIYITAEDIADACGGTQHPRSAPHPETEPLAPRQNYGAPGRRQTRAPQAPVRQQVPPQQKLILHRTHLVQQDQLPSRQLAAGAIWGEETQANPPQSIQSPPSPPVTEELAPKKQVPISPSTTPHQDTLELLALLRTKKKK